MTASTYYRTLRVLFTRYIFDEASDQNFNDNDVTPPLFPRGIEFRIAHHPNFFSCKSRIPDTEVIRIALLRSSQFTAVGFPPRFIFRSCILKYYAANNATFRSDVHPREFFLPLRRPASIESASIGAPIRIEPSRKSFARRRGRRVSMRGASRGDLHGVRESRHAPPRTKAHVSP